MGFRLRPEDVERFLQALHNRGLVSWLLLIVSSLSRLLANRLQQAGRIVQNRKKMSKADSATVLDFGEASQTGAPPPSVEVRSMFCQMLMS